MSKKIPFFVPTDPPFDPEKEEVSKWQAESETDFRSKVFAIDAKQHCELQTIPDGWATPLLFASALSDDRHPVHKRALRLWRCLIALVALREQRRLTVSFKSIPLPGTAPVPMLSGLAGAYLPRSGPFGLDWTPVQLISLQHGPAGIFSPLSVVAPAAVLMGGELQDIPGKLEERAEKEASAARILRTQANIAREVLSHDIAALRDGGELAHLRPTLAGWLKALDVKLRSALAAFLDKLAEQGAAEAIVDSHAQEAKKIFGVIENYINDLGFDPAKVVAIAADRLLVPADIPAAQYLTAVKPLACFSAKLAYLPVQENKGRRINDRWLAGRTPEREFLAPLSGEWISSWLEPHAKDDPSGERVRGALEKLVAGLAIKRAHNRRDEWLVELKVDDISASHRFSGNEVVELTNEPITALWPAIWRTGWKRYYSYSASAGVNWADSEGKPLIFLAKPSAPPSSDKQPPATQPSVTVARCERDRKPEDTTRRDFKSREIVAAIDGFPSWFSCYCYAGNDANRQELDCGVILPPAPIERKVGSPPERWFVAVDFGTTSTVVWCKPQDANGHYGPPKPVILSKPDLQWLTGSFALHADDARQNFLLPDVYEVRPQDTNDRGQGQFLTLINRFEADIGEAEEIWPILKTAIFIPSETYSTVETFIPSTVKGGLKWGTTAEAEKHLRVYILQVLLQICARAAEERVKEVQVRYTFPTAMDKMHRGWIDVAWALAAESVAKWSGLRVEVDRKTEDRGGNGVKPSQRSQACVAEAVANGLYFRSPEGGYAVLEAGAVTLDIGGGTTDFAIWGAGEGLAKSLRLHSSVLFAGQEILLKTIVKHADFFVWLEKQIGPSNDPRVAALAAAANESTKDYRILEAIVRQRGEQWRQKLGKIPTPPAMRSSLAIRLGALYFYAGLIWRIKADAANPPVPVPQALCSGGSAAQLLKWLAPITPEFESDFAIKLFSQGAGLKESQIKHHISKHRKLEVVLGLLEDASLEGIDFGETRTYAGERFSRGQAELTESEEFSEPANLTGLRCDKFPMLSAYLSAFNTAVEGSDLIRAQPIDANIGREMARPIRNAFSPTPPSSLKPLFFIALDTYLQASDQAAPDTALR